MCNVAMVTYLTHILAPLTGHFCQTCSKVHSIGVAEASPQARISNELELVFPILRSTALKKNVQTLTKMPSAQLTETKPGWKECYGQITG